MSKKQKIASLTLKLRALEEQSYIDVKYWRERARSAEARLEHNKPPEHFPEPLTESEQERFSKELEDYSEPNEHVNNMPDEHRQRVISKYYKCLEPVFGGGFMFSTIGAYSISAEEMRIIADYIDEKEEHEHEIPSVY